MRNPLPHSQRAGSRRQDSAARFAAGLACLALALICLPSAVQGQVIYSDNFTNSGTITPWIAESGNWTETGGQMVGGINTTESYGFAYVTNSASNYTVQAQIHFSTTSAYGGGLGGYLNPTNGAHYAAWVYPEASTAMGLGAVPLQDVLILLKFQSWTAYGYQGTNFATMATVSLAGYGGVGLNTNTVKLGFLGNQITVSYNGTQVINTNDVEAVPYTNGAISLDFWTDPDTYNFYVGDLVMSAQSTTPVANNDSYNAVSGRLLTVAAPGVLANDTGGTGPLSAILQTSPAHGTFSFSTNGGFTYTPAGNFTGTDSFTYKATDGHTNSAAATVTLNVSADQPPVANNDSYSVQANNTLTVTAPGVLANDTDTNGFSLTALLANGPTNGVLNLSTNGGFTYTPATNFSGTDSFTYYANDGDLDSTSPATVTLAVLPATTLFFDTFTGSLSPWVLEMGDWTVTGGQLVDTGVTGGNYGYVYLTNIWTNYSVQSQIQFSSSNGWGGGIGGRLTNVTTGAHYGAWVYPGGSDGGSNVLKLIKFQTWTSFAYNGSNGVPMQTVSLPGVGTNVHTLKMAFLGNQIAVYYDGVEMISMADTDTGGSPYLTGGVTADSYTDSTEYNLSYDNVIVSALANNDSYSVNEDTPLTVSVPGVLANDTDGFGTNLGAVQVTGPAHGSLSLNTNGGFTYTPNNGFLGQDSFTYQATEGTNNLGTATVYLTVSFMGAGLVFSQNFDSVTAPAMPSGWSNSFSGAQSNWMTTTVTNDTAPNSAFVGDPPSVGVASLTSPNITLPVGAAQLSFRNDYNLENNTTNGDGAIGYDGGILEIKIGTNAFTDIIAAGGTFVSGGYTNVISTQFGSPIAGQPAWSGISGGFINTVVDLPESASGQTIQLMWVCATDMGNGPGNWTGWYIDTITISNCVSLTCWNLAPVLPAQPNLTNNELTLLTVTNTATELNSNATTIGYALVSPTPTNVSITTNGIITWTPSQTQSHTTNTITTVVTNSDPSDAVSPHLTATNSFTVVVREINVAPSLPSQSNRISAGLTTVTVTNTATNANIHATNSGYVLTSAPSGASISTNGIITWTPLASQVPSTNLFTTVVTNSDPFDTVNPHLTATNSFTVTVNAVHNGPSLPSQPTTLTNNELILLTVTNTAIDTDVPALTLTYSLPAPTPTNVSITTNGIITWTPAQNQSPSTNTIKTVVTDNGSPNLSATNNITVVVREVNVAPTLPNQPTTLTNNELVLLTVTNTATNANIHATNIGYTLVSPTPTNVSITTNGIITWTPAQNQSPSTNTITTVVTNNDPYDTVNPHLTATNSITVVVKEINVAPSLPPQSNLITAGLASVTVTNSATNANIHATNSGYVLTSAPGGAAISANGIITWTPNAGQVPSTNLFTTVVTNSDPFDTVNPHLTATNSFTVTVNAVHNGPSLPNQPTTLTNNELVLLTVTNTAIDTDVPALTLTYSLPAPTPTNVSITTNGIITWTPAQNQSPSTNTITTVVTDNGSPNLSATNSITVVVKEINVAPSLPPQSNLITAGLASVTVTNTATNANIHATNSGYVLTSAPGGASISANGIITWTPNAGQVPSTNLFTTVVTNTDSFDLVNPHLTATNSFTVTVNAVHNGPSLPNQSTTLTNNELVLLTVTNTAIDTDVPALTLTYSLPAPTPTNVSITTNGIITWTPAQNQSPSTNTITTVVTDNGSPNLSATNSITVVVKEINVAPTLPPQSNLITAGLASVTVTNTATNANIHATNSGYVLTSAPGGASISPNGIITWTPNAGQVPSTNLFTTVVTNTDSFDLVNPHLTATNSFTVTVNAIHNGPSLPNQPTTLTNNELVLLTVTNTAIDTDVPALTLTYSLPAPTPTNVSITTNGIITWTPAQNQSPSTNTITTVVTDNGSPNLSATNSITVVVKEINVAPSLPPQSNLITAGLASVTVTNTATNANIHATNSGYVLTSAPGGASISANGIITWTPNAGQVPSTNLFTTVVTNTDSFDLVNPHLTATNSFTVTVNAVHNGPSLPNQSTTLTNNELVLLTVTNTAIDTDVPALTLTYSLPAPTPTNVSITTNGIITWTPAQNQSPSTNTITTVVTDNGSPNLSATNSITVVVKEINVAPTLPPQSNLITAGLASVTVTNTATNANIHATNSGYVLTSAPGGASISPNGIITWTPNAGQVPSTNLFTTVVTNTDSFDLVNPHLTATNSFTVTVNAIHNGPSLPSQPATLTNNELVLLTVTNTAIDTDIPALTLTYSLPAPTPTNVSITTNGIITWTPSQTQSPSTNTITTVVTDNGSPNLSATNSFTVVVKEVNVAPSLPPQTNMTVSELTLLTVTNTATNANIHATNIAYGLVNAPAGANIDTNGIITWTPGQNQSPSTNTITTVVTNSDPLDTVNPQLTATNSFTVVVQEMNVPPTLPPQSNLITAGLASVTVTNTATNANIHAAITGYGLTSAPAGAGIDTNGIITWTPTVSQVPSTNLFTTVVTNSDPLDTVNPQLTATNSFTVTVNAIHNGPSLPSQTGRTITEPATLTVTNTAIDTDIPALTLTYALVAPTPAGVGISTNGIITWTPNGGQAPSTNTIATVVTDSGTPNLSATNSFTVVVNPNAPAPVIQSITASNGSVVITWSSVAGRSYLPQYKNAVTDSNWNNITPNVLAAGPASSVTNNPGGATLRFYRIGLLP